MSKLSLAALLSLLLVLSLPLLQIPTVAAYTPHAGDTFSYYEVENLNNGTGTYSGYTEHTTVSGSETMNSVSGNTVSASWDYSYNWSNNEGQTQSTSTSGTYTWSSSTFLYLDGTDDQTGYVNPTVWFYMNSSLPTGGAFFVLNTGMTIISKNYSYYLPSVGKDVSTIYAQGISSYYGSPDNNAYGLLNAKYTWDEYFDPTTGYVIGYNYVEQDSNASLSFTYTDTLYVTSASYVAATQGSSTIETSTSPTQSSTGPISTGSTSNNSLYVGIAVVAIIVIVIAVLALVLSRRNRKGALPKHSPGESSVPEHYTPPSPPPGPPPSIDLTPTQPPVQQIVIKEVAKVKCSYCGALIDSTAKTCPVCGAPRN